MPMVLIINFLNYYSDPAFLFKHEEGDVAKIISENQNVTGFANIDERMLQKKIIEKLKHNPQIIIFGSSRIMEVGSHYYENSFNNGVSGASLEDLIAIYQIYKEKSIIPKKIVIGIDPWLFNNNHGQIRWKSLKNYYDNYHNNSVYLINEIPFHILSQLISISYFQASVKYLPKRLENHNSIVATSESNNVTMTKLVDGTISYGYDYRNKTGSDVESAALNYINGNIYSIESFNEISKKIKTEFKKFIVGLLKNDIEIEFLLMPYHPIVWKHIEENEKYKTVQEVEAYIYDFAIKNSITITGSYNPEQFALSSDDFYDGMHLSPDGIEKVLKQQ